MILWFQTISNKTKTQIYIVFPFKSMLMLKVYNCAQMKLMVNVTAFFVEP